MKKKIICSIGTTIASVGLIIFLYQSVSLLAPLFFGGEYSGCHQGMAIFLIGHLIIPVVIPFLFMLIMFLLNKQFSLGLNIKALFLIGGGEIVAYAVFTWRQFTSSYWGDIEKTTFFISLVMVVFLNVGPYIRFKRSHSVKEKF